jgi:hypothetical protein
LGVARAEITGENLREDCASYPRPGQSSGFCIAYIAGAIDTTRYVNAMVKGKLVCEPPGVSGKQLIAMAIKFLSDHPEKLHLPGAVLIFNMYAEAFPCK